MKGEVFKYGCYMPALSNCTYGSINFYLGSFGGMGAPSVKHEAHERSDFNMLWGDGCGECEARST